MPDTKRYILSVLYGSIYVSSRTTKKGRTEWKGHEGTSWCDMNVLYFIGGTGYMDIHNYVIVKTPSAENLRLVHFIVVNLFH